MAEVTLKQAVEIAVNHQKAGNFGEAENIYRQVLQKDPRNVDALNMMGVLAYQVGQHERGAELIGRAIQIMPQIADFHNNQGAALRAGGRVNEAIEAFGRAIQLKEVFPAAHNNLGNAFRQAARYDEAILSYRKAIEQQPDYVEAYSNMADAMRDAGRPAEAEVEYRKALELRPDFAVAWNNLGNVLKVLGRGAESAEAYATAVQVRPQLPEGHNNLGLYLFSQGRLDEALSECATAIQLKKDFADAYNNLGNVLREMGRMEEALGAYRSALGINPALAEAQSNYLYGLYFHPAYDAKAILTQHRKWGAAIRKAVADLGQVRTVFPNTRDPDRRLKVGYVSPDLRQHPIGRFMAPILEGHNRLQFEIIVYSGLTHEDDVTRRCKNASNGWVLTAGLSDEALAKRIADDQIDLLVDLTLHMGGTRLPIFARRPAPVQLTYLSYPGTSGLAAMDWRLTDRELDPTPASETHYVEKSWRLASYWCYEAPKEAPDSVSDLPAKSSGHITFGCLNSFTKMSDAALETWARILAAVDGSHLLLQSDEGTHRDRVYQMMERAGVARDRVEIVGKQPMNEYFATYNRIDIALDPFPYAGGTTTCDAMWMGVPVVTLAGKTAVQRGGVSLLTRVGLEGLIAADRDDYVQVASQLASDTASLSELRRELRGMMSQSRLMDKRAFVTDLESAYRQIWHKWSGVD